MDAAHLRFLTKTCYINPLLLLLLDGTFDPIHPEVFDPVTQSLNIKIKHPARVSNYDASTKMLLTANSTAIHNNNNDRFTALCPGLLV